MKNPGHYDASGWLRAFGEATGRAKIKQQNADFQVFEELSFQAEGQGEHVFIQLEKNGENTEYIARQLARLAGVRQRDIGFAGLKDRHAVTTQWFSIWLPGKAEPDWRSIETESVKILQLTRHLRKLKRGTVKRNHFIITLRDWEGDEQQFVYRLRQIGTEGFPNYFTEQRFGRDGQNISKALAMFKGQSVKRQQRGLYLSAVRSWLFNQILADRVQAGSWNRLLPGDKCQLNHNNSLFDFDANDPTLAARCQASDLHPAGILFGHHQAALPEQTQQVLNRYAELTAGLLKFDLKADYRALRVIPENLEWQRLSSDQWRLSFSLPSGSYATALIRELLG